jgi:hypothetical protein
MSFFAITNWFWCYNHVEKIHKQPKNCYNQHGKNAVTTTTTTKQTPKTSLDQKYNPEYNRPESLRTQNSYNNNQKKNSTIHDQPELSNKQPTAFAKPKQRKLLKKTFTHANSTVVLLMRKKLKYCQSRNNK